MSISKYFNKAYGVTGFLIFGLSLLISTLGSPALASATTSGTALSPAPRISFTFDDGLTSAYTEAAPILAQYGLTGTDYVPTACMGTTNYCPENTDASYMTWAQVQALQNTYGWEIGSHSVDTPCLASSAVTDPDDCPNPAPLTTAQIDAELANSQTTLASYGINATDFAPPYGDYNNNVIAQIAKYYASMKQFKNAANNTNGWPYSDYYLQDYAGGIEETVTTVPDVEAAINSAITNNQWLVLTFHDILPSPSQNPEDYQYGTAELTQIAAYVQSKEAAGLQSIHVDQGLVSSSTNMFPNGNFAAGISGGWTTDAPATITADNQDNGSYPDPTNSVKIVSTTKDTHLFSPKVAVTTGQTYIMKNFLNVTQTSGGEIGYYVDEYNSAGQWISGKWLKAENSAFVEDMNFTYTPSSSNVAYASLQIIATGTPGTTAYVDNSQMFPESSSTAQPTNLLPNGTFTAGISDGWSTDDPADIYGDSNNNGSPSSPVYSVALNSKTTNANGHLFSPLITVSSADTYSLSAWLNIKKITNTTSGEVAFYIDEYNSSGQWISGQYKVGVHTLGVNNISFGYTPSSVNVTKASLQVIVVGNAGISAYIDNAAWYL